MILTPSILARLVAVVIVGVIVQLSFFSGVEVAGVRPNLLPAMVVVLGLLGGTMTGAVVGFSAGLLVDCLLIAPLGGSSLVLLGVGYLGGLFRERFEIHNSLVVPLLCMALTILAELGSGAVALLLGLDTAVSPLVIRDILFKGLFAFLLGWPIYAGLRRLLRPALIDDLKAHKRRERPRRPRRGAGRRRAGDSDRRAGERPTVLGT